MLILCKHIYIQYIIYIYISDVCVCGHDGHVMPRDDLAAPTPCCLGETFLEKPWGFQKPVQNR